jgi:hypothetical protein
MERPIEKREREEIKERGENIKVFFPYLLKHCQVHSSHRVIHQNFLKAF